MNQKDLFDKKKGFTLIEVMIVVAILAIIAAIAVPSYRRYVLEVNRKASIAYMNDLGQALERLYTNNNGTYGVAGTYTLNTTTGMYGTIISAPATTDPRGYTTELVIGALGQSFTITATPDTAQSKDRCGTLTIGNDGSREAKKGGTVVTGCFR